MITPQQKAHFYDFGFIRLRQQFLAAEMERLGDDVDKLFAEQRGGGPPGQSQGLEDIVEKSPVATRMLVDDRIFGTVEELLGPRFIWNGSGGSLSYEPVAKVHSGLRPSLAPESSVALPPRLSPKSTRS